MRETVNRWKPKFHALLITYLQLLPALNKRGQQDKQAFVERAYQVVLKRSVDEAGLNSFVNLLEKGIPRWVVVEILLGSEEYRGVKSELSPAVILHSLRCQLVQQLPPAKIIVDLGGAASGTLEGALLAMGYPHQPHEITIIDLPPDIRLFAADFVFLNDETSNWITVGSTRVRYWHRSMTDLSELADESVDLVWSGESIEHITFTEAGLMFQEVWRVLKPGGYFCLDTPNRRITQIQCPDQFIHPEHKIEYTVPQLIDYLSQAGFKIDQVMGLAPMPKVAQTRVFDWQEMMEQPKFSKNVEECYLFYLKCLKPGDK